MTDLGPGVAPGQHEYRIAARDGVRYKGVLRLQVEDVVLVDARRYDHERTRSDLGGGRRVLDQLDQLVFVHHLPRGDGKVAADLESLIVGLADAALLHVAHQVRQAARQALAAALERLLHRFGIGRREVRRAHRIDPLPHGKAGALLRLRVELGALHQLFQIARREKIRLPEVVVVGVVAPFLRRKAPVARSWIGQRRGLPGEQARPQLRLLLEVRGLHRAQLCAAALQVGQPRRRAGRSRSARQQPHPSLGHFVARLRDRGQDGVGGARLHRGRFCDAQEAPSMIIKLLKSSTF